MAKQEDFQLKESARELRLATTQLRDFNQSAGVEIAKTVGSDLKKGVIDPFTNTFAQIPGVSTLGSVGKTILNKTFAFAKEARERKLLRQQLGLSKEEFKQLELNKRVLDAQKKFGEQISEGAEKLLGFSPERIAQALEVGLTDTNLGIKELTREQQIQIEKDEKRFAKGEAFKSREAAEKARADRKEEARTNIFQDIAEGIKGLAKGAVTATKAGGGFLSKALDTLFLPLGAVGAVVGAFIAGFVKQIKNDFGPLFKTLGNMFRGLKLRISSVIAPPFRKLFGEKGPFGAFFKFLGETVGKIKTSFTTAKDSLSKNLFIRTIGKVGETIGKVARGVFGIFSNVIGRLREAGTIASKLPIIQTISKFAAGFGTVLGKLFLPITIVIGAFDLITGFIDGWTESEGNNIYSKFVDGVGGALSKLIGNLIGIPLDLLKKGVVFLIKKGFGLETDEEGNIKEGQGIPGKVAKFLQDFSFTDIIKKIIKAPFTLISTVANKIVDMFKNFSIKESLNELKTYISDLAPRFFKRLLRGILPAPDFLKFEIPSNKATEFFGLAGKGGDFNPIPKGVYKFAGINYDTGEIEGPKPSSQQTLDLGRAGLQDDFFKARKEGDIEKMEELIREAEEQRQNNVVINQIYNQQDQSQNSSSPTLFNETISDNGAPAGAYVMGPS